MITSLNEFNKKYKNDSDKPELSDSTPVSISESLPVSIEEKPIEEKPIEEKLDEPIAVIKPKTVIDEKTKLAIREKIRLQEEEELKLSESTKLVQESAVELNDKTKLEEQLKLEEQSRLQLEARLKLEQEEKTKLELLEKIKQEERAKLQLEAKLKLELEEKAKLEEKSIIDNFSGYKLYRDKQEFFSCDIMIEGAKSENAVVRLIVESTEWNLVFNGKLDDNKITIPIKKLPILEEGSRGKIRLEVLVEDTMFVPWEEDFLVQNSKKVSVKIHEQHKSVDDDKIKVNINVKK